MVHPCRIVAAGSFHLVSFWGSPRHQDVISFYNRAVGGCTNLYVPFSEWTPGLFSKRSVFHAHASLCFSVRHSGCSRLGLLLSVLLSTLLSTFLFGPMVSFFLTVHLRGELLAPAVSLCFCLSWSCFWKSLCALTSHGKEHWRLLVSHVESA